jgi:hypothetical protein
MITTASKITIPGEMNHRAETLMHQIIPFFLECYVDAFMDQNEYYYNLAHFFKKKFWEVLVIHREVRNPA